jgi:hypothetical protein
MQKRYSLSLCAKARLLVDEPNSGKAALAERVFQVIYREADVVNARPTPFEELSDGGVGLVSFEEFHQGFAGVEAADSRAVAVGELGLGHSEDSAIE